MDMNIKGIDPVVLQAAKVEAARQGVTLKAFVVGAIQVVLGGGMADAGLRKRSAVQGVGEVAKARTSGSVETLRSTAGSSPAPATNLIPGEKCNLCGAGVYAEKNLNTGVVKWKCVGKVKHTMSPREPKEKP